VIVVSTMNGVCDVTISVSAASGAAASIETPMVSECPPARLRVIASPA